MNTVLHNGEWVVEHETKKWESQGSNPRSTFCASVAESFSSTSGLVSVAEPISSSSKPTGTSFQ
eukprot:11983466-Prorocentrum_lima.AAC.1